MYFDHLTNISKLNTFTPRSDKHVTSCYDVYTLSSTYWLENIQTNQIEVVILI